MTEVDVIEAGDGVRVSAAALRAEGRSVRYLGATLIAADEVVFTHSMRRIGPPSTR